MNDTGKKWLVMLAFILFSVLLIGGFYLFTTPGQTVNLAFAYVVGLSMIVLPCTLPLAFVIVPLAMGKGPKKGLGMALAFGLGLSITLSIYGLFIGFVGQALGLEDAVGSAGTVSRILFIIGGLAAFVFGLSELKLIKFEMPSYKGSYPRFIQEQGDYLKAFFLGLFLGNAGVGCPNPLFYVLLGDIALTGSMVTGAWLGFIHGVGRATPLIFLAILGILGVNAVSNIASKTALVTKLTGASLIVLGAFIFISGTSHQWYEESFVHKGWNQMVILVTGGENSQIAEIEEHEEEPGTPEEHGHDEVVAEEDDHADSPDYIPAPYSWITLWILIIVPLLIYWVRERRAKKMTETKIN
ncbi:cytochrome C biogenesis protein [bacterium]|nr:cytochrome C biogenesis protein [bacterium]|tara:strand:+ start:184 stop:1248 length:1065 start_codon:yes stop_codon:yes gene_type:complete